jgi:hypothetical protein
MTKKLQTFTRLYRYLCRGLSKQRQVSVRGFYSVPFYKKKPRTLTNKNGYMFAVKTTLPIKTGKKNAHNYPAVCE